ncbi:MAG TPA: ABC transporter permease, partial [Methylobacterium sp.]|nr:ABC transporter permease [Methylobacterium sp.]
MIGAAFRVMLLSLVRDRAALVMAFVLPTVIFAIFAAIFSGAIGDRIRIHLGLADLARTATTARLMSALEADPSLRVTRLDAASLPDIVGIVRRGEVDVALVLRGDLSAAPAPTTLTGTTSGAGAAPPPDQPVVL